MNDDEDESLSIAAALNTEDICYYPNYINEDEEAKLLQNIKRAPIPKWITTKERRLQQWGGQPHAKGMVLTPLPSWLDDVIRSFDQFNPNRCVNNDKIDNNIIEDCSNITNMGYHGKLFPSKPNHVLINEYLPGQGINAHEDGPLYHPLVAIVSLGNPIVMNFFSKNDRRRPVKQLLLAPRSLLVFKDTAYTHFLHHIEDNRDVDYIQWNDYGGEDDDITNIADFMKRGGFVKAAHVYDLYDTASSNSNNNNNDNDRQDEYDNSKFHAIPRDTRYSLTIRIVKNVLKNSLLLGARK